MVYVFYQLCSHTSSRQYVRDQTEATPYLLDLLHDRNPEVQRVCDATLQMIGTVTQYVWVIFGSCFWLFHPP